MLVPRRELVPHCLKRAEPKDGCGIVARTHWVQ